MITDFNIFESYLEGGRQPLYHYTHNLNGIMKTDMLKTHRASDKEISISFTRSSYYEEGKTNIRIVLDADKLKLDGYKIIPWDEGGNALSKQNKKSDTYKQWGKANPNIEIGDDKQRLRSIINNVGFEYDDWALENEYEERCFEDITDIGKYIIAFDLTKSEIRNLSDDKTFIEYMKKYNHIKITELKSNLYDRRNELKKGVRKPILKKYINNNYETS